VGQMDQHQIITTQLEQMLLQMKKRNHPIY
jgi:hypothetical protein